MNKRRAEEVYATVILDTLHSNREQGKPEVEVSDLLGEVRRTIPKSELGRTALSPLGPLYALLRLEAAEKIVSRSQRHPGPYDNSSPGTFYRLVELEESVPVPPKTDFRRYLPK
jgi:hypothetical protein